MSGGDAVALRPRQPDHLWTRDVRNRVRFELWLRQHPAAAAEMISTLLELGDAAWQQAFNATWDEALASAYRWH